jgi:hypothetical protein
VDEFFFDNIYDDNTNKKFEENNINNEPDNIVDKIINKITAGIIPRYSELQDFENSKYDLLNNHDNIHNFQKKYKSLDKYLNAYEDLEFAKKK